jgi:hypothetical protein
MGGNDGWGSDLWKQLQQVKVTRDDGIKAPVSADGKDGIVVGRPGLFRRLKLRIARG